MIAFYIFLPFLGIQGIRSNILYPRIWNGRHVFYKECRSFAAIFWRFPIFGYKQAAGGTILNKNWIMTGAHVIKGISSLDNMLIKVGLTKKNTPMDHIQIFKPVDKAVHEGHNGPMSPYDIGLLKTNASIMKTEYVQYAYLPEKDSVFTGRADMYGFGQTVDSSLAPTSEDMKMATLETMSNELCQPYIDKDKIDRTLLNSQMCAHAPGKKISGLYGDSGGPLLHSLYSDNGEKEEVIGIISWRFKVRGRAGLPTIFTRVSYFIDWIKDKIRELE